MDNFKVVEAQDPWMYDRLGLFMETLQKNKKCLSFKHELYSYIECYSKKNDKEAKQTSEWDLAPLKRDWLDILGVKKH